MGLAELLWRRAQRHSIDASCRSARVCLGMDSSGVLSHDVSCRVVGSEFSCKGVSCHGDVGGSADRVACGPSGPCAHGVEVRRGTFHRRAE